MWMPHTAECVSHLADLACVVRPRFNSPFSASLGSVMVWKSYTHFWLRSGIIILKQHPAFLWILAKKLLLKHCFPLFFFLGTADIKKMFRVSLTARALVWCRETSQQKLSHNIVPFSIACDVCKVSNTGVRRKSRDSLQNLSSRSWWLKISSNLSTLPNMNMAPGRGAQRWRLHFPTPVFQMLC